MTNHMLWVSVAILSCLCSFSVRAAEPVEVELQAAVEQLFAAVQTNDAEALDGIACTQLMAHAQHERRVRLGLLPGGKAAEQLIQLETGYRDAVHAKVSDWLQGGRSLNLVDVSRIKSASVSTQEYLMGNRETADPAMAVIADGIVTINLNPDGLVIDIPVYKIEANWCLVPTTVP
jgi:hypothetical protein